MTPDVTQPCCLGSCDVRAIEGKLEVVVASMRSGIESEALAEMHTVFRLVLDACNECRAIVAHAQRGGFGESAMPYREPKGRLDRL